MITDEQAQEAKEQLVLFLTDCKETLFSILPRMERYIDWEFWGGEPFRERIAAWGESDKIDMAKPYFKRIFTALIAAINNTLQSITEATGIGEALREMKDLMQNLMA